MRWWWSNNQVEVEPLISELENLKESGFGGVEINPILDPIFSIQNKKWSSVPMVELHSPEWHQVVFDVARRAKELDMGVGILAGSGWPLGGDFLDEKGTAYRLVVHHDIVEGPKTHEASAAEIYKRKRAYAATKYGKGRRAKDEMMFIQLFPYERDEIDGAKDVMSALDKDGSISIEVPKGKYVICYGVLEQHFRFCG